MSVTERWAFAFALFAVLAPLTVAWLVHLRRRRALGRPPGATARWLGATCVALYALILLEVAAGLFLVKSDGYGITRAGTLWFTRHWRPFNSLGYRDVEPVPPAPGQRVLLVTGDSLAAGHGIERIEDRFASVLSRALGPSWRVPVAAVPGWNVGEISAAVEAWPGRVDQVLYSCTLTDVETAANDVGRSRPDPAILPPPPVVRTLVARSYVFNWVYWRWLRSDFGTRYPDFIDACYRDPAVTAAYEARLRALITAVRSRGAELRVVLWPDVPRIEACAAPLAQLASFFAAEGVPVLDLSERLRGRDPGALTVNELDEHPNEAVHREVGAWIAAWLGT